MFLHGYMANKECFLRQIRYFSAFCRVTALDFAGFGGSDAPKTAFSVADYADWTRAVLDLVGVREPVLVGHSFGARVAIEMAAAGAAKALFLVGAAGIVPKRTLSYHLRVRAYRLCKKIAPRYAKRHFGSEEYRKLSPLMQESYKKIVNTDLRDTARRIRCPVKLVYGAEDKETPARYGKLYREAMPHAELCVWEGCGHFLFLEQPLRFELALEQFLSQV